ncbi:MAG: group III truncated hemoglobin [Alphaproteobacteria bacterium]|nr:group III truncated hemoglobin [Alphaproteobacteria bacterium]
MTEPRVDEAMIRTLVHAFYAKVRADAELGPIFDRAIGSEWDVHLAKMCDFWSSVMLTSGRYHGNPMGAHLKLKSVTPAHFQRWLALFRQTATEVCDPASAAQFVAKAENIARSLQMGMFWRVKQAAKAVAMVVLASALGFLVLPSSRADDKAPSNVVEALQRQLDAGTAKLPFADDGHGYVPGLLAALNIPRDSQLLVFSASSLQFDRIGPKTPRALYYQDDAAIGTVLDGRLIEVMAADRDQGVAFYTLDTAKTDKPHFERRGGECIICHGFASRWAPGMMVANMDTGPDGKPLNLDPAHIFRLTDHRTPFEERYGGWYVTGQTGAMHHRGNVTLDPADPLAVPPGGLNLASVSARIQAASYLEPGSDVVSLLTLEHQSGFVNLVTRINAQYHGLDNPQVKPELRATQQDIDFSIAELTGYMVFADEVALPSPVTGSSDFAREFESRGPRDRQGRSLRQFDLKTRLFHYPLSYMLYSQSFDNLNPLAKEKLWHQLYNLLLKKGVAGAAAINIATATQKDLPAFWKPVAEN